MDELYKREHEAFVSGSGGTTVFEIVCLSLLTPIWSICITIVFSFQDIRNFWIRSILESFLLMFPLISGVTFISQHVPSLFLFITILTTFVCYLSNSRISLNKPRSSDRYTAFLSHYRSQLLLDTSISILAVDFQVYPRRLAKTEVFGFGYMDVGVGCFVFAAGVLSTEARGIAITSRWKHLKSAVRSNALMALIGIVRAVSIWAMNYHVQVSEYGVHWNFFLTIAAVRVLCSSLLSFVSLKVLSISVGLVTLYYQWLLTNRGLTDFILDKERHGLFEQNKEGFLSLIGYCLLYLAAVHVSKSIFSSKTKRDVLYNLSAVSFFSFIAMSFSHCLLQPTSRRLLNISYIFWMISFNCFQLAFFVIRDLLCFKYCNETSLYIAINRNATFYFLVANLAVGTVNFAMNTIYVSTFVSVPVIFLYSIGLSVFMMYLHKNNLVVDLLRLKIKGH